MSDSNRSDEPTVLGVEIGGTKLQVGYGTVSGKLWRLWRCHARPHGGARAILGDVYGLLGQALRHAAEHDWPKPGAIGIGFGGPVDAVRGATLISHQVDGWKDYPLVQDFSQRFDLPVRLENDASTAALAEATLGGGKGFKRVFYVTVGSGIGGGWVLNGGLDPGQGIGMAEIGHLACQDEQGRWVRLEDVASGWGIQAHARRQLEREPEAGAALLKAAGGEPSKITTEEIARCAARGDDFSLRMLGYGAEYLGWGLANMITLLAPDRVVIGGGVALAGESYWRMLQESVERHVFHLFRGRYELVPSELGENVVVAGALLVAGARLP